MVWTSVCTLPDFENDTLLWFVKTDEMLPVLAIFTSTTTSEIQILRSFPFFLFLKIIMYRETIVSTSNYIKMLITITTDQSGDLEEETWSPVISPIRTKSDKSDFTYISDILRASQYQLPEESDVFLLLEKQQYLKGSDTSKVSSLQRKLIFDTINEIIDRYKQRPPWKAFPVPSLDKVWSDFQTIREPESAEDLFETICGVLKRDLAGDDGWGEFPVEKSEAVLEIERLIFKDVICEAMRDLTALPNRCTLLSSIRKLIF